MMSHPRKLGIWEAWLRSHASPASWTREGRGIPARARRWGRLLAFLHRPTGAGPEAPRCDECGGGESETEPGAVEHTLGCSHYCH